MNEQIKKLILVACEDETLEGLPLMEKFAELIVRECADIAKHHVMNISTYADAEFVEKQIKTHFGMNNE